ARRGTCDRGARRSALSRTRAARAPPRRRSRTAACAYRRARRRRREDVELLPDPVDVRLPLFWILGEVAHVAEVEEVGVLASVLGQFGADLLRLLESLDVVATEAAVFGDDLLPFVGHGGELLRLSLAQCRRRGVLRF